MDGEEILEGRLSLDNFVAYLLTTRHESSRTSCVDSMEETRIIRKLALAIKRSSVLFVVFASQCSKMIFSSLFVPLCRTIC